MCVQDKLQNKSTVLPKQGDCCPHPGALCTMVCSAAHLGEQCAPWHVAQRTHPEDRCTANSNFNWRFCNAISAENGRQLLTTIIKCAGTIASWSCQSHKLFKPQVNYISKTRQRAPVGHGYYNMMQYR